NQGTSAGQAQQRTAGSFATDHKSGRTFDNGAQEISNGLENQGTSAGQAQQRTAGSLATDHKSGRSFDNGAQEFTPLHSASTQAQEQK
ncbi:MAG: hypothetical protein IT242_05170, partial [Bacteroidia bacterium]|nr:hypothetical protein [Bacteroidia bacterium]